MADETRERAMTDHLLELRAQQKTAHEFAEYFNTQVMNWENSMIQLGVPIQSANKGGQPAARRAEDEAVLETAGAEPAQQELQQEPEKDRKPETASPVSGHRLGELRKMPDDSMTQNEKREQDLLEQLVACPNQKSMMRAIATRTGAKNQDSYRIEISSAAIHIVGAGRSRMEARNLGNHLRYTIMNDDAEHWTVDKNKNDAQFFPDGKDREGELENSNPRPQNGANTMLPL